MKAVKYFAIAAWHWLLAMWFRGLGRLLQWAGR